MPSGASSAPRGALDFCAPTKVGARHRRNTHARRPSLMPVSVAPQYFLLGHQPAEVTCRALITGRAGDPQHAFRRHLALRLLDSGRDQLGESIDIAWSRLWRWWTAGL